MRRFLVTEFGSKVDGRHCNATRQFIWSIHMQEAPPNHALDLSVVLRGKKKEKEKDKILVAFPFGPAHAKHGLQIWNHKTSESRIPLVRSIKEARSDMS